MKHTPRPWTVDHWSDQRGTRYWIEGDGLNGLGEPSANARLIAAAPDLLAACEQIVEWYDLIKQNYPEMDGLLRGMRAARGAIDSATH